MTLRTSFSSRSDLIAYIQHLANKERHLFDHERDGKEKFFHLGRFNGFNTVLKILRHAEIGDEK